MWGWRVWGYGWKVWGWNVGIGGCGGGMLGYEGVRDMRMCEVW